MYPSKSGSDIHSFLCAQTVNFRKNDLADLVIFRRAMFFFCSCCSYFYWCFFSCCFYAILLENLLHNWHFMCVRVCMCVCVTNVCIDFVFFSILLLFFKFFTHTLRLRKNYIPTNIHHQNVPKHTLTIPLNIKIMSISLYLSTVFDLFS